MCKESFKISNIRVFSVGLYHWEKVLCVRTYNRASVAQYSRPMYTLKKKERHCICYLAKSTFSTSFSVSMPEVTVVDGPP
jgi:hypothetical protein